MNFLNSSLVEGGTRAGAEIRVRNTAGEELWMLLPLVRASLVSSSLPPGRRLWQELKQACRLAIIEKVKTSFSK